MNIALGILTCPRPKGPLLPRTLASVGNGWLGDPFVWQDSQLIGQFRSWLNMAESILKHRSNADAYFLIEDDVVFCRWLRSFLDRWPADPSTIAFCSPYCPQAYAASGSGWHKENAGWLLSSCQTWFVPRDVLIEIVETFGPLRKWPGHLHNADCMIGQWAKAKGLDLWWHSPSLAQHIGNDNSAFLRDGGKVDPKVRSACDFIGEEATCEPLIPLWERMGRPTDKGSDHSYLPTYERLLSRRRFDPLRLLELGVYHGGSLRLWREYLPRAMIIGVDIKPLPDTEGLNVIAGDVTDPATVDSLGSFDVIIDDASHDPQQQLAAFQLLRSHLRTGGVYVIEDLRNDAATELLLRHAPFQVEDFRKRSGRPDDVLLIYEN